MALPCPPSSAQGVGSLDTALGWEALCGSGGTSNTGESCSSSAYPGQLNVFQERTGKIKGIGNSGEGCG